jgi:hypothetical protein
VAFSVAIVAAIIAYAIPKFADYRSVWVILRALTWPQLGLLAAATLFNLVTYWLQLMASLPGPTLGPGRGQQPDHHLGRQHHARRRYRGRRGLLYDEVGGDPWTGLAQCAELAPSPQGPNHGPFCWSRRRWRPAAVLRFLGR